MIITILPFNLWCVCAHIAIELWEAEDIRQIIADYGLVVIIRDPVDLDQAKEIKRVLLGRYPDEHGTFIQLINPLVKTNISSTQIRELIDRGLSIRYLVPDVVYRYIKEKDLFNQHNKQRT